MSVLAIAAEREMPLAPAVVAFADQYRGGSYRRIMDLAAQIELGDRSFPRHSSGRAKLVSRDARPAGLGRSSRRQAAAGLANGRDVQVDPLADLDGDHRAAFLHPRAPAGHADHHGVYHVFHHAQV